MARRADAPSIAARPHRAIFIDVENTSSAAALFEVIDSLAIDRFKEVVELFAVGNWRTVGQQVGREIAALGAQLIHSAPARGVRDWSDLWIAVAAGGWIAHAVPGDVLEIVSNDRAFDAVADAAAAQGVVYRRILHRRGAAPAAAVETSHETAPARRSRGGRRRRPRRPISTDAAVAPSTVAPQSAAHSAPPRASHSASHSTSHSAPSSDPHGASPEQLVQLVRQLADGRPSRWVNLDVLENALKREGFSRPPNSPRLVTRLRRLKDFEIDSHGRVCLADDAAAPAVEPTSAEAPSAAPKRRRRRTSKAAATGETIEPTAAPPPQAPPAEAQPEGTKPKRRRKSKAADGGETIAAKAKAPAAPPPEKAPAAPPPAKPSPKRRRRPAVKTAVAE